MKYVCTGCSCLCDDIVIGDKIYHSCRKGVKYFKKERETAKVGGENTTIDKAFNMALEMLNDSKKLAIFGMDKITCQAQIKAIKIAKKLEAVIDDNSSIKGGSLVELSLKLPKTTLEQIRDEAYVIVYWGTNPHQSMPRHLSRYTYYPRSGKRQRGYEEDRYLVTIDVRYSETAKLANMAKKGNFIMGKDEDVVSSFIKAMDGKAGKYPEAAKILKEMQKSDLNVIFGGSGLEFGLKRNYENFEKMLEKMNEITKVAFIPAVSETNMRGFNELMFKETGFVNAYDFSTNNRKSFSDAILRGEIDTVLIISNDPIKSLSWQISEKLKDVNVILINSYSSLTSKIADVAIPSEPSPFVKGSMCRHDGVKVDMTGNLENSDEYILENILKEVR